MKSKLMQQALEKITRQTAEILELPLDELENVAGGTGPIVLPPRYFVPDPSDTRIPLPKPVPDPIAGGDGPRNIIDRSYPPP